jgi:hypothetical protein
VRAGIEREMVDEIAAGKERARDAGNHSVSLGRAADEHLEPGATDRDR